MARSISAAMLLLGSLVATCTALASEDALPKQVEGRLQPSREINPSTIALGRLALALSSGGEAMRPFHGAPSDTDDQKDKLDPSIPDMDCSIDRRSLAISHAIAL